MENRLKDAERIIDEMEKENNLSKVEDLIKEMHGEEKAALTSETLTVR